MKRAVLFQFHKHFRVCRSHVQLLSAFNPDVQIFGLFGGNEKLFSVIEKTASLLFGSSLTDLYCISGQSGRWKRDNTDLAARLWYSDRGRRYDFDVLHHIQWDLVLFAPLGDVYKGVPLDGVGLTGLTPLSSIADKWSWTTREPDRIKWQQLLAFARTTFGYDQDPYACQGPGPCLPRAFLEKYAATDVPTLCHDELRLPLIAQCLGFKLYDTGICRDWLDPSERKFFNADTFAIESATIKSELAKPGGRRAFHPFRDTVKASWAQHAV